MDLNNLADDQKAKARTCKSADELAALAKEQGVELTDDQLEGVTGGLNGLPNLPGIPGFCEEKVLECANHSDPEI